MRGSLNRLVLRNFVSPYGLAFVSTLVFLLAWIFPPDLYTHYINEPDYMFLDLETGVFFAACCASFCLGVRAYDAYFRGRATEIQTTQLVVNKPLLYLCVPLVLSTLACAGYLYVLGGQINFIGLLINQQGNAIKESLHTGGENASGVFVHTLSWQTGMLWWSLYRMLQVKLPQSSKVWFYTLFGIGFLVDLATCMATASRGALLPLLIGISIILIFSKLQARSVKLRNVVMLGAGGALTFIGFFLVLAFIRGAGSLDLLAFALLGYTLASYNRLTAILQGVMHYTFGGTGIYLVPMMVEEGKLQSIMSSHFNWPPYFLLWQSEFTSTFLAGLNKAFIWAGVFGYVYSDIGWFAPVYMFITGLFVAWIWNLFLRGKISGLVLYPFLAFWILFWIGSNVIWNDQFVELLALVVALVLYEKNWSLRSAVSPGMLPQRQASNS